MWQKVLLMLCFSALASAGIIGTDYSPATSVSYSSVSTPAVVKTVTNPFIEKSFAAPIGYTKIIQTPPVYESVLTTKESKFQTPDGTQHSSFSKSFDTGYSSLKNGSDLGNTIPGIYFTSVHSPIVYHPHTSYTYSSPLSHTINTPVFSKSISVPVAYATHNVPLTKTLVTPSIYQSAPLVSNTKVITSDFSSYSSPLVHNINAPAYTKSVSLPSVTYTAHGIPSTKTIVSPSLTSYTTPVISKSKVITPGLSSYSSYAPDIEAQPIKTTLTYSEAPIVSHMSFSGLGTNYSW